MSIRPLVFVAMPFGKKRDEQLGLEIDFDEIYENGIKPALKSLPVEFTRADEVHGGIIHRSMFEWLLLAEVVIIDATIENANVFYELGVRHAAKRRSTIIISGNIRKIPFDISMMSTLTYSLTDGKLSAQSAQELCDTITDAVSAALSPAGSDDSPVFQLMPSYQGTRAEAAQATILSRRRREIDAVRKRLRKAVTATTAEPVNEVRSIVRDLGRLTEATADLVPDVVTSYRDIGAFADLIDFVETATQSVAISVPVSQQYALALNRRDEGNDRARATEILEGLCSAGLAQAESYGILGRIHKDLHIEARASGDTLRAAGHLAVAIEYYRQGFAADIRQYYTGVNLATLLRWEGGAVPEQESRDIVPVVTLAATLARRASGNSYWTLATLLEAAALNDDWRAANAILGSIMASPRVPGFYLQSTCRQLSITYSTLRLDRPSELESILLNMLPMLPPELLGECLVGLPVDFVEKLRERLSPQSRGAIANGVTVRGHGVEARSPGSGVEPRT